MRNPINLKEYLFNRRFHHLIFWSLVITGIILLNRSENFQIISDLNLLILCFSLPIPVYLHFYILTKFFDRKKYLDYAILTVLLILVSSLALRSLFSEEMRKYNPVFTFIINLTIFLIITTGLKFLKSNFSKRIQIQQARSMELQTETDLIKTRLNPGFMMKTLNHLHHLSLQKSPQVPSLILQFAEMLRHTLESPGKKEVTLSDELNYITAFISLEKLISGHDFSVEFRGDMKQKIIPLLLVSLVEQVFSSLNKITGKPQRGMVRLKSSDTRIGISIDIKKNTDMKKITVDLSAIRQRIEQSYPGRSNLAIQDKGKTWTASIHLIQQQPGQSEELIS
jgi:hypothetical protein